MSFLLQLSLSPVLLIAPLLLLLTSDPHSHLASPRPYGANLRKSIPLILELVLYSVLLTVASTVVAGSWAWIPQTWGARYVV